MEGSRALAATEPAGKSGFWILGDATGRGCGVGPATLGDQTYNKKKRGRDQKPGLECRRGGMRLPSTPQPQQKRTLATGQGPGADQAAGAEERLVSINASSVWLWRGWVERKKN